MESTVFKCFLAVICLAFVNSQSACPPTWTKGHGKKCYFIEKNHHSYEGAKERCGGIGGKLAIIKEQGEQTFLNNFIFNASAIDGDVWIGATRISPREFQWEDRSPLNYENWAPGSPSRVDGRDCAVMEPPSSNSAGGDWIDMACSKGNYAVCETNSHWSPAEVRQKLAETIAELENMKKNPVPIGFKYTQLPGQPSPSSLWPNVEWKEISSEFEGKFFRVVGGGAEAFGSTQAAAAPSLLRVNRTETTGTRWITNQVNVTAGTWSWNILTGSYVEGGNHPHQHLRFLVSNPEIRPVNTAVRIWIRLS